MAEKEAKKEKKENKVPVSKEEKIELISKLSADYNKNLGEFFDEQVVKSRADRLETYKDLSRGTGKFKPVRLLLAEKILDVNELGKEFIRKHSPQVGGYVIYAPTGLKYLPAKLFNKLYAKA